MPAYRARNVKIRLVASSLNDCTTINPTNTSVIALPDAIRCEEALRKATILSERLIADSADETKLNLHLITNAHGAVPLYLAHVRRQLPVDIIQKSPPRLSTRHHNVSVADNDNSRKDNTNDMPNEYNQCNLDRKQPAPQSSPFVPTMIDPDCQPYALGILIELSKLTCGHPTAYQSAAQDIRYDVFLNGDLVCSDFIENRHISVGSEKSTTILVGGRRVASFIERPIIVLPLGLDAKGEIVAANRAKYKVHERWDLISKAFAKHACELRYWLKDGERESPLATFFDSLASFKLPSELEDLPPRGPQMFGIIDVIISCGRGAIKQNAKFMNNAKLMQKGLSSRQQARHADREGSNCSTSFQQQSSCTSDYMNLAQGGHQEDLEMTRAAETARMNKSPCSISNPATESSLKSHITPFYAATVSSSPHANSHRQSAEQYTIKYATGGRKMIPAKRKCVDLVTTTEQASPHSDGAPRNDLSNGRKTVKGYLQKLNDANGCTLTTHSTTAVGPYLSDSVGETHNKGDHATQKRPMDTNNHPASVARPNKGPPENGTQSQPSLIGIQSCNGIRAPLTKELAKDKRKNDPWYTPKGVMWEMLENITDMSAEWMCPTLCKDSFLSYAEDGVWRTTMEKAGFARNVKGVKQSDFEETEVMFATRYFVS